MKMLLRCLVLGLAFSLTLVSVVSAETRYVSDNLVITVRELPDDESPHIKNVTTDTPLEVLEERGEYLKVRLENGDEGYVKTRYTTTATPKTTIIDNLNRENSRLQQQYDDLKASLNEQQSSGLSKQKELQAELERLKKELAQKTASNSSLETELAKLDKEHTTLKNNAENVVQIVNQAEELRVENERLAVEFESMQDENAMLLRTAVIKWVLTGAGILFLGWIMGKASRNKRRY